MVSFKHDEVYGLVVDSVDICDIPDDAEENIKYNLLEGNSDWDERDIGVCDYDGNCGFINLSDFPEVHKGIIKDLYYQIKNEWEDLYEDFEDIWKSFDHWNEWFKATYKKNFKEEFKNEQEEKK